MFQPKPVSTADPAKPVVTIDHDAFQELGIREFTTNVVAELNRVYSDGASTSFTNALVGNKSIGLERRKTSNEKRKEKRAVERAVTKKVNECFAEKAAITLLAEGESKRKYHRKRLAQSFCSPEDRPQPPKQKKHSPNFANVSWETEKLATTLNNWPTGRTWDRWWQCWANSKRVCY